MDQQKYSAYRARVAGPDQESSWLSRALRLIVILTLLVVGFMFSLVVFAVLAVAGLLVWAYFWWKTRKLRQLLQEQAATGMPDTSPRERRARFDEGNVIEGEVIREEMTPDIKPGDDDQK